MSPYNLSTRGVVARSLLKISGTGLLARLLKKSLYKLFLARMEELFCQVLCTRSLSYTNCLRHKGSPCKTSAQGLQQKLPCYQYDLCKGSPWPSAIKMSPAPQFRANQTGPKYREGCTSNVKKCILVARAISQEPFCAETYKENAAWPGRGTPLCASLRSRHAHGQVTKATSCKNLQVECHPRRIPHRTNTRP